MFGGSNNIKLLLEKNQIWETYHDKVSIDDAIASYVKAMKERRDDVLNKAKEFINENQEYIAGIDPIPMPDGEIRKAEIAKVIVMDSDDEGTLGRFLVHHKESLRLEGKRAVFPYKDELDPNDPVVRARFAEFEKLFEKKRFTGKSRGMYLEALGSYGIEADRKDVEFFFADRDSGRKNPHLEKMAKEVAMDYSNYRVYESPGVPSNSFLGIYKTEVERIMRERGCGTMEAVAIYNGLQNRDVDRQLFNKFFRRDIEIEKRRNMFDCLDLWEARKAKREFRLKQRKDKAMLISAMEFWSKGLPFIYSTGRIYG